MGAELIILGLSNASSANLKTAKLIFAIRRYTEQT